MNSNTCFTDESQLILSSHQLRMIPYGHIEDVAYAHKISLVIWQPLKAYLISKGFIIDIIINFIY